MNDARLEDASGVRTVLNEAKVIDSDAGSCFGARKVPESRALVHSETIWGLVISLGRPRVVNSSIAN